MPNAEEICKIEARGKVYSAWTSMSLSSAYNEVAMVGAFGVGEILNSKTTFDTLQLLPGDPVKVSLAGRPAMAGFVVDRQAAYDARTHRAQIVAYSKTGDLAHSQLPLKGGQFRNTKFASIARRVLEPFGIGLRIENGGADAERPFKEAQINPGETAFAFLDRLASMRGLFLTTDPSGVLIAHRLGNDGLFAELVEGRNILSATCQISDLSAFNSGQVVGQQRGDDHTDGDRARKPAAAVGWGEFGRYKNKLVFPENPGDQDELRIRADHMARVDMAAKIEAVVTVQGWLAPQGDLWAIRKLVKVRSPMLVLDKVLGVARVQFAQDRDIGTRTTLMLVRPGAMGLTAPLDTPPSGGNIWPGGTPAPAKPSDEEDRT